MDFFEHQSRARAKSVWLVILFCIAVASLIFLTNIFGALVLIWNGHDPSDLNRYQTFYLILSIGTAIFIALFSIGKIFALSLQGGVSIALSLNGRNISPETIEPDERKLMNIVEEMSIASGVPRPEVFVFEDSSINAFAAGHSLKDAVIGLTSGAIQQLNRDELQGVVAHEYSHILNEDMSLNMRILGVLHGIMAISTLGSFLMRARGRKSGQVILIGFGLWLIGSGGRLFGQLIQAAISREREYLADASAVQFTRNPDGIAGALKKILKQNSEISLENAWAGEMSHFFISSPFAQRGFFSFRTHPPLEDRIKRILKIHSHRKLDLEDVKLHKRIPPKTNSLRQAEGLLGLVPQMALLSAYDVYSARGVVYALFMSKNPETFQKQIAILENRNQRPFARAAERYHLELKEKIDQVCIPLIDLALPALRKMSTPQRLQFLGILDEIIQADHETDAFEYSLRKVLELHLRTEDKKIQKPNREEAEQAFHVLIQNFHIFSKSNPEQQSMQTKDILRAKGFRLIAPPEIEKFDSKAFDRAINVLSAAPRPLREVLTQTLLEIVKSDSRLDIREIELLRALSLCWEIPLPPLAKAA